MTLDGDTDACKKPLVKWILSNMAMWDFITNCQISTPLDRLKMLSV